MKSFSAFFQKLKGLKANRKLLWGVGGTLGVFALVGSSVFVGMKIAAKKAQAPAAEQVAATEHGKEEHGSKDRAPAAAHDEKADAHADSKATAEAPKKTGFFGSIVHAITSAGDKVAELRRADEENQRLRLENANLRLKLEASQFDCHAQDAAKNTRDLETKLDRETGTKMGRALASISYKFPTHLLPPQLYTLAMSYFKAREDEKAAVILTFLLGMEDDDAFRTAKNFLLTGVSWYRLDNMAAAQDYFDRAMKSPDLDEYPTLKGQVRLWKALVASRVGKHAESQTWMREVLNLNPHSTEAKWVNQAREASRAVASHE